MKNGTTGTARRGRGALSNPDNRFDSHQREPFDDGWCDADGRADGVPTTLSVDASRSVLTYNRSPDVGFDRSINPYRGCEHGCVYCYARPSHAWLGLSPGLDFESRLLYKPEAAALLRDELARPGYACAPVAVGVNTDAYQPVERTLGITRAILEVLQECRHPLQLVTKSALVERDVDLLAPMAAAGLAAVTISVTCLDRRLSRNMEPRAAAPQRRLETIRRLAAAGIPVTVLVAPVVPVLTDGQLERILKEARDAGARHAGYVLLRLPRETGGLFRDWLEHHLPLKADHVMRRVMDSHGGEVYDSRFGRRMRGEGIFAELIGQRFRVASRRLGYAAAPSLDSSRFRPPARDRAQLPLF